MKHLFHRLLKLAQVLLGLAVLAILAGFPPLWVGLSVLFVLDFAAIAWVGGKSAGGGRRKTAPLGALCVIAT